VTSSYHYEDAYKDIPEQEVYLKEWMIRDYLGKSVLFITHPGIPCCQVYFCLILTFLLLLKGTKMTFGYTVGDASLKKLMRSLKPNQPVNQALLSEIEKKHMQSTSLPSRHSSS